MTDQTVWDRILQCAAENEITGYSAIGRIVGVSHNAVRGWENGSELAASNLIGLADAFKVEPLWLQTGFGPKRRNDFLANHAFVPFFRDARVAAGLTAINDDYQSVGGLAFLRSSLAAKELDPDSCRVIRVEGDSMLPNIRPGDAVMYDTTDNSPIVGGKIYVFDYGDDGGLVKRLFAEPDGRIIIRSDNPSPEFNDRVARLSDISIHGRVRWIGRWES